MKRSTVVTLLIFGTVIVSMVGLMSKGDHRTDRNVPGATTGAGKASITDSQQTFVERGVDPPPR